MRTRDEAAERLDAEVDRLMQEAYENALSILTEHREQFERVTVEPWLSARLDDESSSEISALLRDWRT